MKLFKKKTCTQDFINQFVSAIIRTDTPIQIGNSGLTLYEVRQIKDYIPVFRLQLLWYHLTISSDSTFQFAHRTSLLFNAIENACATYGLDQKKTNELKDKVYALQERFEQMAQTTDLHSEDKVFHLCNNFAEVVFPDTLHREQRFQCVMLAKQIYRKLEKAFTSVRLIDG